jgi:NAD(P)H-dependent FMN reductase
MPKQVGVIVGSVRTGRMGKPIADWVMKMGSMYEGELAFNLLDLKEINLPFMDEPAPPMMTDDYVHEHTRRWSAMVKACDALILVAPEYNGGYAPVLKNAIDFLYKEWADMPAGIVAYSGGGPKNSIRQLREILDKVGMNVLDHTVTIGKAWDAIDEDGNVKPESMRGKVNDLFRGLELELNSQLSA